MPPAPEVQLRPAIAGLARGLRDAGGGRASLVVRLDPPELGPVVVRLHVVRGHVVVQLHPQEQSGADGLAQSHVDVQAVLAEHGLQLTSFEVRGPAERDATTLGPGQPDNAGHSGQPGQPGTTPERGTPGNRTNADGTRSTTGPAVAENVLAPAAAGTWL